MDSHGPLAGWRALNSALALRRRLVVAALTGIAVISGLSALRSGPVATTAVWVASHDLPGGKPLTAADVRIERLPRADVPTDALGGSASVVGNLLAAPMRTGEPLTDVRLLSTALLSATGPPGDVAVPVRVADGPAALALVRAGDLIDILAAADPEDGGPATTTTVARGVRVLASPARLDDASGDSDATAGLIVVAATSQEAAALAQASTGARLSVAVRRQP